MWPRKSSTSTKGIPIRVRWRASISIDSSGRTGFDAARIIICSGLPDPFGKSSPFWLPAAVRHRRRTCLALARGTGYRHRLQRHQRALYRGSEAQIQARQSPRAAAAIERVSELETSFDQIVCTGVLHHLRTLMLGSEPSAACSNQTGRCISWCMRLTDGPASICCKSSADGSDPCYRRGNSGPDSRAQGVVAWTSAAALLREAPDFQHEAALADALLHPQDRAYSVPQLFDFINRVGLTFGRWIRQAPYSPHCGAIARIPQAPRMARLSLAEQYAAVELFRGTMVSTASSRTGTIARARNRSALTVRHGWTTCRCVCPTPSWVQERLPPGSAAVLINLQPTYTDIYLPIDAPASRCSTRSTATAVSATSWKKACSLTAASHRGWMSPAASSSGCGGTTRWCSTRHSNAQRPVCRPARHLDTAETNFVDF